MPATLEMTEDEASRLPPRPVLNLFGHPLGNPAEQDLLPAGVFVFPGEHLATDGHRALRRHHDGEVPLATVPVLDLLAHHVHVEGDLGDQDHIGSARHPGVQRDPARVPPHDLHDHGPLVAGRRGVELVQGIRRRADRGVVPECDHSPRHVVVDGLGDADHRDSHVGQPPRDLQRPVSADAHDGIQPQLPHTLQDMAGHVLDDRLAADPRPILERIPAVGRPKDRAAHGEDAGHVLGGQLLRHPRFEQAVEAPPDADHFPAPVERGLHGRPDHGVEAWGIPATGRDADPANDGLPRQVCACGHRRTSRMPRAETTPPG